MYNYIVTNGDFEDRKDTIVFKGKTNEYDDQLTGEHKKASLYGDILFADVFKGGKVSFDIKFADVCEDTRCGVLFNYSNDDGIPKCHQAGVRNRYDAYGLGYYI